MAVETGLIKQAYGVTYTVRTADSADWPSVANSTRFYDIADDVIYFKDSLGNVISLFESGGDNIYTADGTLTGARSVTMGGNNLTLTGGSLLMDGSINMTNGVFTIEEISGASTPAAGIGKVYAKTDGTLRYINDAGTEYNMTPTGFTGTGAYTNFTIVNGIITSAS